MQKIKLIRNTKYALEGRVVTLDKDSTVLESGVIYIEDDTIVDIRSMKSPAPTGFGKKSIIKTGGTIYPGMIELHNHLSYNILPTWAVPKKFSDRDQWRAHKEYRPKMTGPLKILGHMDSYLQAIVRYVECRLLFSGITTSQGISLASHGGIQKLYQGVVRNVEKTLDPDLPNAATRIADIKNPEKLLKRLHKKKCYLLHLAEGTSDRANKHFQALKIDPQQWAITDSLCGIHALGLHGEDFATLGRHGGSMVWSPMSNLLLYGATADVATAKRSSVKIALGADWSASGSKNLLCELKVAKTISSEKGNIFTDEELVRMVTSTPAEILKWNKTVGSLEVGKKADLIVIRGKTTEPYQKFIHAKEQNISFVCIGGLPRFGNKRLMHKFDVPLESIKMGKYQRYFYLKNETTENPIDIDVSYGEAKSKLEEGMAKLPQFAKKMEGGTTGLFSGAASSSRSSIGEISTTKWFLANDHDDEPLYADKLEKDRLNAASLQHASTPLSDLVQPIKLDKASIADDKYYFQNLAKQKNLPEYIKRKLPLYYGQSIKLAQTTQDAFNLSDDVKQNFESIDVLSSFYDTAGWLNWQDRMDVIDQASAILSQAYVHLPLKKAMHASNPIEHLRILKRNIQENREDFNELDLHRAIIKIFNSVRDLHTTYQLPSPYAEKVAFLPFSIERYFEGGEAKYLVSRIFTKHDSINFLAGVKITHWNNVPIEQAIKLNADRFAGSNKAAHFARGLNTMTFRPMQVMLPPNAEKVRIHYISDDLRRRHITFPWLIGTRFSPQDTDTVEGKRASGVAQTAKGYDYLTQQVNAVKKCFVIPKIVAEDRQLQSQMRPLSGTADIDETAFPSHFIAKIIHKNQQAVGYIRIFSFNTDEVDPFVSEFKRLFDLLISQTKGVILDLRSNGGGHIIAAEAMLQVLTKRSTKAQRSQFILSPLIEQICQLHSPSTALEDFDLSPWLKFIPELKQTGASYTRGHPLSPRSDLRKYRAKQNSNVILITDALCYSATDIFASGFKDHKLGKILGIDRNTGAGGANVWTHDLLEYLVHGDEFVTDGLLKWLPYGTNFTVAIRRTLRVKDQLGIPLEDLGVEPDHLHLMTRNDLLNDNEDLIERACGLL